MALLLPLLGSLVDERTVTVSLIAVPAVVPAFTCRTTEKLPLPGTRLGFVQVIVPDDPTAGCTQAHPAGGAIDWKFVAGGVTSVNVAFVAVLGPAFETTCV